MSLLPQKTILGNLEILEVYEFYDKPCLFSCRNLAGQLFLVIWIEETSSFDTWLYVPTSLRRLEQIITGGMELRNGFLEAEDGFVFEVILAHHDHSATLVTLSAKTLSENKLPAIGQFLNCDSQIRSLVEKQDKKRAAIAYTTNPAF